MTAKLRNQQTSLYEVQNVVATLSEHDGLYEVQNAVATLSEHAGLT